MDNNDKTIFDDDFDFEPISPSLETGEELKLNEKKETKIINNTARILPVIAFLFVSVLGIYIFINNVNADKVNLIKIEEKEKVGYINKTGNVIVRPKYLYGSDFYKGYAVVKNYNNLYGIINGKGDDEISFGNIFSASLYEDRYIVTKFTNEGLKMGLLNSNLKEVTRFIYDNLSYINDSLFMYTKNDVMGIMNKDGKEIYSYKVDEVDDRKISAEVSNITNNSNEYAKVKVNSSSTIVNIKTGKEAYNYTLDEINVLDNNVFYIKKKDGNNHYFIIKNDKVVFETVSYKRVRVDDIDSDIAIAVKEDSSIDYINLLNKEIINKEEGIKYTYSDGIILEEGYNFSSQKNEYKVYTPLKVLSTFSDIKSYDNTYVNGYMKIVTSNNKYNYIDKYGNILLNKEYEIAGDFNKYGYAIVSNDNAYGVINSKGKEIISLDYDNIKFLDDELFDNISKRNNDELFIFNNNGKYGIINSKNKVLVRAIYDDVSLVTNKYPIVKVKYDGDNILLNLETYKDISINSNKDIQIYDDYIISNGIYYNYEGTKIYSAGGDTK